MLLGKPQAIERNISTDTVDFDNYKPQHPMFKRAAAQSSSSKQRRRAVSDVGSLISRMLALRECDDENCVGDVGKWGPFYMKYIGSILGKNPINFDAFIRKWDNAIVVQMNALSNMIIAKSAEDLKTKPQYKTIQEARERWKKEAKAWGLKKWEEKAKEGLAKRQTMLTRRRAKTALKEESSAMSFQA